MYEDLPPLREVISAHNLRAEKSLGQNFLLDMNITDKIARSAGDLSGKHVLEIGPGPGGLTRSLLKSGARKVTSIEYDPRAIAALADLEKASKGQLQVVHEDALNITLSNIFEGGCGGVIVANLPYNIATPLLTGWLKEISVSPPGLCESMTLLFQKEVAERLYASHGNKTYGRISVFSQYMCDVRRCFDIPASAFTPPPKITSTLVHLNVKQQRDPSPPIELLEEITARAFGQRRKMVRSSMKSFAQYFDQAEIPPEFRAEDLSVEQYIKLASLVS